MLDDRDRAQQAFLAARLVSPDSRLPIDLIPAEHPVRQRYGALPLDAAGSQPVRPPRRGSTRIDGAPSTARPTQAPVVFQVQIDDGAASHTRYLWPDEPLPPYPRARTAAQRAWLWSGVATGLAGAAAYGGAWVTRGRYDDPATPAAQLDGLRSTTNALGFTGVALGVAGAGLVVTGLLPDT